VFGSNMSLWHYTMFYAEYPLRYSARSGRLRVRVLWRGTWSVFDTLSPFDGLESSSGSPDALVSLSFVS